MPPLHRELPQGNQGRTEHRPNIAPCSHPLIEDHDQFLARRLARLLAAKIKQLAFGIAPKEIPFIERELARQNLIDLPARRDVRIAASDIYAPLDGEIVAANGELDGSPELVNEDPYGSWIFRLRPSDPAQMAQLLDAAGYARSVGEE
ncbi:MAG: hypothetical protein JNJ60_01960 [Rhodocyclaceae bacterium]|nr:hypothetical protein [Rhodocyclaceae bacterium]